MVKEIKIDSLDVDYLKDMDQLVKEDLAGRVSKDVGGEVDTQGESAARVPQAPEVAVKRAEERGIDEEPDIDLHEVMAKRVGMEYVKLNDYGATDRKVLRMLPAEQAKQYEVYPLSFDPKTDTLLIAISDPSNPTIVDDLQLMLGHNIEAVVARRDTILERINRSYGVGDETMGTIIEELEPEDESQTITIDTGNVIDISNLDDIQHKEPIVRLTDLILLKAIQDRASDIHIEPFENLLRVRYRVDGILREMDSPPKEMQIGLISRLKVMANLDIAESRRPQDGRINLRLPDQREVELRVTSAPTVHGEGIVMRVLDKSMMQIGITQLGMNEEILERFIRDARKPNGIVLVTGPTGCGKTTTLYSAIHEIKSLEEKFITTEDPVEYQVEGIIQVHINEAVGLTYARCLRAILRQDPDRILVGEIRDLDTAKMAIESALTGHLVYSTLHTNSAAGTITRLLDMGIEPFLITSALQSVVGQRLVRTVCPNCRISYQPSDGELSEFHVARKDVEDIEFVEGKGCNECGHTGYRGRIGVFEYLPISDSIMELILESATTDEIHARARLEGMASLRDDGWEKIRMGVTTTREVISHTPAEEFTQSGEAHVSVDLEA